MSEHVPSPNIAIKWLFPVILLSIIALLALYIVRDNYNDRTRNPAIGVNKDTRSDYTSPGALENPENASPGTHRVDSSARERGSQPELDTTR